MTKEIIRQDLEFLLSQQTDLIKILKFKREDTRKNINSLLKNKIPDIDVIKHKIDRLYKLFYPFE